MNQRINFPGSMTNAWRQHERRWKENHYVYPVVSRRSRGISIGINLNPNKACNFDCIYCQVNRGLPSKISKIDLEKIAKELDDILRAEKQGVLYEDAPLNILAPEDRGVRDIAFSGDGEPTLYPHFQEVVRIAADARRRFGLDSAKLVLLTNAAYLNRASVRTALALMDANNGEIWAKLDAGTEAYFRKVNRSNIPLDRILDNILGAAQIRPLVIQTLWFRIEGAAPSAAEIEAYCSRLKSLISDGGQLKAIHLYTIARDPAEKDASPLSPEEMNQIAALVKSAVAVSVETFI
jgi:wyosine [tRNA(Phe)-imidazoG37] synthetase (radical SAM superfamily)